MCRLRLRLIAGLVCIGALVAVPAANASPGLLVAGAGSSTTSGQIDVIARAAAPAAGPDYPVAPAEGFIRARGSFLGDFSGSVTCIASVSPEAAIVSGVLDAPFVSNGFVFPNFTLIVEVGNEGIPPWIHFFIDDVTFLGPCGQSLLFSAGIPDLANDVVVQGHFSVLALPVARPSAFASP